MRAAVISVSKDGRDLSRKIAEALVPVCLTERFVFEKYADGGCEKFSDTAELTARLFGGFDALVFVCACGIAVRAIAPHVRSKTTDPAVVVVDDLGKFAIPILSGHIGGANRLAELIAEGIGATAAVTTATDVHGRFSPDSFAKANGLVIDDMNAAKEIAAAVLRGENIGLVSDFPLVNVPRGAVVDGSCRAGLVISNDPLYKPFEVTLNLIPRNIALGIGCRRGVSSEVIERHALSVLEGAGIDIRRVKTLASIDLKADEQGLLGFSEKLGAPIRFFTAAELMSAEGGFSSSGFVRGITGADNVCERAAVCCGGRLVIRKAAAKGVTAAAAELPVEIDFQRETTL